MIIFLNCPSCARIVQFSCALLSSRNSSQKLEPWSGVGVGVDRILLGVGVGKILLGVGVGRILLGVGVVRMLLGVGVGRILAGVGEGGGR